MGLTVSPCISSFGNLTKLVLSCAHDMPAKSRAQQRLAQAALHGADFPKARKMREGMDTAELKAFASRVEHESHAYDFRRQNSLKQNRGRG